MRGRSFKEFFTNRRALYMILCIVLISVFSLTIAYATLSVTLNITGNAEVVASNWDIHLANPKVKSGSVHKNLPSISGNTLTFSSNLEVPGDFYEFTIDVVNNGSIDAMIDSVVVTPTLTDSQKKYLRYEVTYQNGEIISNKQILRKNSSMPINVRIEFRSDIPVSDLPSTATSLNHEVTLVYSQSDGTGSSVSGNGKLINIISGTGTNTGDEVCIGTECFYVMYSGEDSVTMLAKYNLYVGNTYDGSTVTPLANPTGVQDETAKGWFSGYNASNPLIGTKSFSSTNYWSRTISTYPAYVYNENSYLYEYVENYKSYLEGLGAEINEARLITIEELEGLGCSRSSISCSGAPEWVYGTTYWSGSTDSTYRVWRVGSTGRLDEDEYRDDSLYGVRPVITISKFFF